MPGHKGNSKGNGVRIALIDSGVDKSHPLFKNLHFSSKSLAVLSEGFDDSINDSNGHGTAICGIFAKQIPNVEIIVIKIFSGNELITTKEQLISALIYVEGIDCDIVHMSLGTLYYSFELEEVCNRLINKGVILVSAYDNAGAISYPAAFKGVIAVEADKRCRHIDEFMLVEDNGRITILAKGGNHRLAWVGSSYVINQGSSFSAGYVTAYLAKKMSNLANVNLANRPNKAVDILRNGAKKSIKLAKLDPPNLTSIPYSINAAIIFPYNKEIHSLVNYTDLLPFEIKGICDIKYSGHIGLIAKSLDKRFEFKIDSIENMDWKNSDTLILGHTNEMMMEVSSNIRDKLFQLCLEYNLNIYAFDELETQNYIDQFRKKNLCIYTPKINSINHLKGYMGKLFHIDKPLIGVFGTTSQQGKFTLQLALRQSFQDLGYIVGQLGTEPSSLLFNFDACFPFGYNSTVNLDARSFIIEINALIHEMVLNRPDIELILTGCQSGTTPMLYNHIDQIPIEQLYFLIASMPDAVILCVNPDDDISFINRAIKTIEGLGECNVIALALYPMTYKNGWNIMNNIKYPLVNYEMIIAEIQNGTGKDVFVIGDKQETDRLRDVCIKYLAE